MMKNKGFTLLELSIVIVIIGLIVAGISAGQSLVKQANIRSQISQIQSFELAFNSFILQYNAIPGDFNNANAYWGSDGVDGDGDKRIEGAAGGWEGDNGDRNGEKIEFFRHLFLAGITSEAYNGDVSVLGEGYPALAYKSSVGMFASGAFRISPISANVCLGAETTASDCVPNYIKGNSFLSLMVCNPSILPNSSNFNDGCGTILVVDTANIDTKIDDGFPASGKFYGVAASGQDCANDDFTGYSLSSTDSCNPQYRLN